MRKGNGLSKNSLFVGNPLRVLLPLALLMMAFPSLGAASAIPWQISIINPSTGRLML